MDKKNISIYLLPAAFVFLLLFPTINSALKIWEFERKDEFRAFTDELVFNPGKLDKFPKDFNDFYKDNFSFNPFILNQYHDLKYNIFKSSPHPDQIILGKNGWFFRAEKEKTIAGGRLDFTPKQLDQYEEEWKYRMHYLDSMGIKAHWMIAPFKHNVHYDQLPNNFNFSKKTRTTQLHERIGDDFPDLFIDPIPALRAVRDSVNLFYRLDNHWNYYAGEIASKLIIDVLRKDFPEADFPAIPHISWEDSLIQSGIHYRVLGIDTLLEVSQNPIMNHVSEEMKLYNFEIPHSFPYPKIYERCFVNDSLPNGIRALFFVDSFAGSMVPFLQDSFKEATLIFDKWKYQLNKQMIERVNPDVVIYISLETHIENFLEFKYQDEMARKQK